MLPKEERDLITLAGRYTYYKMKDLGLPLNIQSYKKYSEEVKKEKRLKKKLGATRYQKMKELKLSYEDFIQHEKEQKLKKYETKREKDKIRQRTVRYIERYCDLDIECQICKTKDNVQIHHPNYKDYLKINLLCIKHHNDLHNFELIPPEIIDLEKIAKIKPPKKEKQNYMNNNLENIKTDIISGGLSYSELSKKYKVSRTLLKSYLEKEKDWEIVQSKLKEAGEKVKYTCNLKHQDNPLQKYRIEHNLTTKELSTITQIPIPTIRAIESGKTDIKKLKPITKQRLEKLKEVI